MSDQEHVDIFWQGLDTWNAWRSDNAELRPDLSYESLERRNGRRRGFRSFGNEPHYSGFDFSNVNLRGCTLSGCIFEGCDFTASQLSDATAWSAVLQGCDLSKSDAQGVCFDHADLSQSRLVGTNLNGSTFFLSNLRSADLSEANLTHCHFRRTDLTGAILTRAQLGYTSFSESDLSPAVGLSDLIHTAPSSIGIDTLQTSIRGLSGADLSDGARVSKGDLARFLRGVGLAEWEIQAAGLYAPNLSPEKIGDLLYQLDALLNSSPLQISPLFISYSHQDSPFVDALEKHLNARGLRFWRDVHEATAGRLERQIDRAIRLNPTVLLILSKNSVESDWVQFEATTARKLEIELGRDVLCPIGLDTSWKTCRWSRRLREQLMEYSILDFSRWEDAKFLEESFGKLVTGLGLYYNRQSDA